MITVCVCWSFEALLNLSPVVIVEVDPVADGEVRHGGERAAVRGERLRIGGQSGIVSGACGLEVRWECNFWRPRRP